MVHLANHHLAEISHTRCPPSFPSLPSQSDCPWLSREESSNTVAAHSYYILISCRKHHRQRDKKHPFIYFTQTKLMSFLVEYLGELWTKENATSKVFEGALSSCEI
jgi:hypothetical protein